MIAALPSNFIDRFKRSLVIYRTKFWSFAALAGLLVLLTMVSSTRDNSLKPYPISGAVIFVLLAFANLVLVVATYALAFGNVRSLRQSLIFGYRRFLSIIWVGLISSLVTIAGWIVFFVPGIILSTRFSLIFPVLIIEDRRGFEALLRSRDLVYGRSLKVFANMFVLGLLPLVLYAIWFLPTILQSKNIIEASTANILDILISGILNLVSPVLLIFMRQLYDDCLVVSTPVAEWIPNRSKLRWYKIYAVLGVIAMIAIPVTAILVIIWTKMPGA